MQPETPKKFTIVDAFNKWWHLLATIGGIIYFLIMAHVQLNSSVEDIKTIKSDMDKMKQELIINKENSKLHKQQLEFIEKINNRILNELESLRKH